MDELAARAHQPIALSEQALRALPPSIAIPRYNRRDLIPGIVHIGVGNFHRAHQAWYLHRLMQMGEAHDWAILGAGVRPYDTAMREKLLAQDWLTTLVSLEPDGVSAEVCGSMIGYITPQVGNEPLVQALADQAIRIVSLTVTEGGYFLDPATEAFDKTHPDIVYDAGHLEAPKTVFGAIVAGLRQRRENGLTPLTVLSCDNLQGNGRIVRQAVVGLASLADRDLAHWIDTQCSFPNSMVDSIVPATGPEELALVRRLGIDDLAPVTHEDFRQWVIEDDFCAGRPDWDKAGATFSNDVHAYEAMKLRILNAGHQMLANAGELLGVATIDQCMAHPTIGAFFSHVQQREVLPLVKAVPHMSPAAYLDQVIRRFANPAVKDTTRRVAFDGSARHTGFVLPILRDALAQGAAMDGLALSQALWARMCFGQREDGSAIDANDPKWAMLVEAARGAKDRPARWLEQGQIYGDLAHDARFRDVFERMLSDLWERGAASVMTDYIARQS